MDLESASLLLISTSSSRSFAFMCLYSLYSSAIGVRSSFWTFLEEAKGREAEAHFLSVLQDSMHQELPSGKHVFYQPAESVLVIESWYLDGLNLDK